MAAERTIRYNAQVNSRHLCNWGVKVKHKRASGLLTPSLQRQNTALLGGVCALALALAFSSSSANAMSRHKAPEKEAEHASKEPFGDAPKGPVEIVVSIDQQKLHLYSGGQHVADTSVATGVPSLPTPLGIFDVIQKQVFHRSNIYSGAPMPFMQRITWSGVALHEGENIGHRASHGCIRMPHDFAARLYQFTKLGARVIVADAELTPSEIADPHLFVHNVAPPPTLPAAPEAAADPAKQQPANSANGIGNKADTAALTDDATSAKPASSRDGAKTGDTLETPKTEVSRNESPETATAPDVEASNKKSSGNEASKSDTSKSDTSKSDTSKSDTSKSDTSKSDTSKSDAAKDAPFGEPPVPTAGSDAAPPVKSSDGAKANDVPQAPRPVTVAMQHVEAVAAAPQPVTKVAERLPPANLRGTDANPTLVVDASNAVVPLSAARPATAVAPAVEKRTPIAIFVSRKTQRIYVRQNFAPLFDAAITVDNPEQPLGTHVFTALDYLTDGSTFRWDVVSLPGVPPKPKQIEFRDRYGRVLRREQIVEKQSGPLPPPQTPAEALARLEIPQNIVDRISEMMVPGSSLIVSDQGLGDETGEGTDFVVVSR
jgi:hypothetical protein